jgi:ABC-2 type transport system ATP-binding protein
VGLADALVHEPDLIILMNRPSGSTQTRSARYRQLIKDSGLASHTVLISTHILPEVELTCHRVLILHKGRILAHDTPDNLQPLVGEWAKCGGDCGQRVGRAQLLWTDGRGRPLRDRRRGRRILPLALLTGRRDIDLRSMVFDLAVERGWKVRELSRTRPSLEDIFVRLTRADREEER